MCVFQRLQSTFEGCKVKFCQNPGMVSLRTLRIPRVPRCQLLCPEPVERGAHGPPTPPEPPQERLIHLWSRMFSMRPGTHDIMCVYRTVANTVTRNHPPIDPSPPSVASPLPGPNLLFLILYGPSAKSRRTNALGHLVRSTFRIKKHHHCFLILDS